MFKRIFYISLRMTTQQLLDSFPVEIITPDKKTYFFIIEKDYKTKGDNFYRISYQSVIDGDDMILKVEDKDIDKALRMLSVQTMKYLSYLLEMNSYEAGK